MVLDQRVRNAMIILAVFVVVIVIGQSMIYVANPYHCDMAIHKNGHNVDVTVDTNYSLEYTINSIRTDSMSKVTSYAVYFDEAYPINGDSVAIHDAIKRLQLYFSNDHCALQTINTLELQNLIFHKDTTTAIIFITGTMPKEIYTGALTSPIFTWLSDGGVMYWLHGKLGATFAEKNGPLTEVYNADLLFFGASDVINSSKDSVFTKNLVKDSLTDKMGIYYGETTNGVNCSKLISPYLALDYNDGTYSAVVLAKYAGGEGVIGVFGGNLRNESVPSSALASVAQTIVSKLSYDSLLIDHVTAFASRTVTLDCGDGFSYVFMYVGRVNSVWAMTLVIPEQQGYYPTTNAKSALHS